MNKEFQKSSVFLSNNYSFKGVCFHLKHEKVFFNQNCMENFVCVLCLCANLYISS